MIERSITGKRVLVTGCAGFIGSNLCEDLLKHDNEVVGLDNFETGFERNITPFKENSRFQFIQGDIRNLEDCKRACDGAEIVLHQAALGSVPRSINDPINSNKTNIDGFLNMLVAARDHKIKRFVYASSSSVYGDEKRLPKVEAKIGKALSPYAVTKSVNEQYAHVFGDLFGLETVGLRYFNVFGKHQSPNGAYAAAIPKFIERLIRLQSPTIHGDGTQSRDFTYIANVVQANNVAAISTNPTAVNEVYNVATGVSTNLNELIDILKEALGAFDSNILNIEPEHGPERVGDVRHSLASIVKAETMLGYKPTHTLEQGLNEAISWYWNDLR